MENYLFIPFNSLNFNNILSSESMSPLSFYEKRGFGFRRYERINANPLANSVLCYNKILKLEAPKSDREEFPVYLAIPKTYLDKQSKEFEVNDLKIYQTDASIHINWKECFFLARNEEERKKIAAGTRRSLEIKHSERYLKRLLLLTDYQINTSNWNESVLENISDFKNPNQNNITQDQKINKIKGLVYGYVSGKLKEQPSELTSGKRYFKEFVNAYSVLMNELSVLSNDSKKVKIDNARVNKEFKHLNDLKERISVLFGGNETKELDGVVKKEFGINESQLNDFKSLSYQKTRYSVYSIISDFVKQRNKDLYSIDELLESLIDKAKSFTRYNSISLYKALDEKFNTHRLLIQNKISNYENIRTSSNSIDKIPFEITNDFSLKNLRPDDVNKVEAQTYSVITKELLSRLELSSTDEVAQSRLDIIQHIAEELTKTLDKDSEELEFLRRLYKSLKTVGVGFKISETSNDALQALACFLSRYQEMDKLQDFMEKNKFQNYGMTYSLWGSAYGYANLSKILLSPLESNEKVLDFLIDYVASITLGKTSLNEDSVNTFLNNLVAEVKSPVIEWNLSNEIKVKEPKTTYTTKKSFNEILNDNKELSKKPEWVLTLGECYDMIMKNDIGGVFSDSSYKAREFERMLNDEKSKGGLKGFGKTKIDLAVSEFLKFMDKSE